MSIADSVARASAYLTGHPEEARYRDSSAKARLEWAVEHCPVTDTVSRSVPLEIEIR